MNTFNPKKRKLLSYQEFWKTGEKVENADHTEKGEHEIVKQSMDGEKKGDKGIATLDECLINANIEWNLSETKEPMDIGFAVFNQHINDAGDRAEQDVKDKFGEDVFKKEMMPIIKKGIMSIFDNAPTEVTKYYAEQVQKYVNGPEYKSKKTIDKEKQDEQIKGNKNKLKKELDELISKNGLTGEDLQDVIDNIGKDKTW